MVATRSQSKLELRITKSTKTTTQTGPKISIKKATSKAIKTSPYFFPDNNNNDNNSSSSTPIQLPVNLDIFQPPAYPSEAGLIQESLSHNLYFLCIQAILWNQTRGAQARPVLAQILTQYPTPTTLAAAPLSSLTALLHPIGLHNIRAARLIAFAKAWVEHPPCKERRYRRVGYPAKGCGLDVKPGEVLGEEDEREGWEVAHLPGMGAYALDSYRIFGRDKLRGVEEDAIVGGWEEWRRVVPLDKDLRRYLVCRWREEGWDWDMLTGKKRRIR